ncbi:ArsR/SmtB family transcription factor [Kitasatospora camelliae]|uniref:Helix-turn-helix domain-containing protein n=1 Tax=Kitasatospora camelliae TaxID=3156397 RepID=A0AAU8JUH2_9ACTN
MTTTATPHGRSAVLPEPAPHEIRLECVLHALADPVRLRIVADLAAAEGELNCLAIDVPVTKSTSTHHFRVLREAGVIRQVRRGTSKMNSLRREELGALFPGLLDSVIAGAARQRGDAGDAGEHEDAGERHLEEA